MKPQRVVFLGVLAMLWIIIVYAAAVGLSSGTDGENVGKLVGTIFSGVAFLPPVVLFMRWYRKQEGRDSRPSSFSERPPEDKLDE